jgi:septal ring factor EnvC (AmiA/AmiB activator)
VRDGYRPAVNFSSSSAKVAASARPSAPGPSAAAVAEQQDAQRRQIADLQQQVAQRSRDLDSARGETVKLREGLDALHQQRKLEEAAATRQKAQEQQMAAAATRPATPRPMPPPAQPTPQRVLQASLAAPTAQPTSAPTAAPPMLAPPAEPRPPA